MLNRRLLKAAMARNDVTQGQLAERIGISENTLSSRITGASCFNLDEIDKICAALDISDNSEKVDIFLSAKSQ